MQQEHRLGKFECQILITLLRLGSLAFAVDVTRQLESDTGRSVSRGALYATLDRLERKGLLEWETAATTSARGGLPRRAFSVTAEGTEALRQAYAHLRQVTTDLADVLGER